MKQKATPAHVGVACREFAIPGGGIGMNYFLIIRTVFASPLDKTMRTK